MLEEKFGKKSDLLERERAIDEEPIKGIQNLFFELSSLRSAGEGNLPAINPMMVEAHLRLTGRTITAWEYQLINEMDLTFRSVIMGRR